MRNRTNQEKREKFAAFRAAGQSVRQAATAVGIAVSTGHIWSKAHGQNKEKDAVSGNGFARLIRQGDVSSAIELEVGRVVIRVPREFDAESLLQLIAVVRRSA